MAGERWRAWPWLAGAALASGIAVASAPPSRPGGDAGAESAPAEAGGGGTPQAWGSLRIAGRDVPPAAKRTVSLRVSDSFAGDGLDIPVLVARGHEPGLTLCLTAGIHGDELNGVEIVRRVFQAIDVTDFRGTLVGLPVVNVSGFRGSSRYLPDRRDLNRYFPGQADGSSAARIAATLFQALIEKCDQLIDFHTGSFHRVNLPQVRGDFADGAVLTLGQSFGIGVMVNNRGMRGTLRRAATTSGLPAITYEAGEPMRFSEEEIGQGVDGVRNVLAAYGMTPGGRRAKRMRIFHQSRWIRTGAAGIFLTPVTVGDAVAVDQVVGTVTDPLSNKQTDIRSPVAGRILGMAVPQVVIPGFAIFHIGLEGDTGEATTTADAEETDEIEQLDEIEQPE